MNNGGVAQLGEHLICIQKVAGSIPVVSTDASVTQSGQSGELLPPRSLVRIQAGARNVQHSGGLHVNTTPLMPL